MTEIIEHRLSEIMTVNRLFRLRNVKTKNEKCQLRYGTYNKITNKLTLLTMLMNRCGSNLTVTLSYYDEKSSDSGQS